ncbi:hypothetical protein ABIE26_002699 [Pedobacter africanus]|uniref:Uncharacterized protein n=1 Tax=Pedobacter africanus TaxID=151894 RepID=A0ACC6KXC2_9SPHI|nr:hypothetical protein [Pedobacter africanus]
MTIMKNFKMLNKAEMKNVKGGEMCPPGYCQSSDGSCFPVDEEGGCSGESSAPKRYKCCPEGQPNSPQCSDCVVVPAGHTATCTLGVVTPC